MGIKFAFAILGIILIFIGYWTRWRFLKKSWNNGGFIFPRITGLVTGNDLNENIKNLFAIFVIISGVLVLFVGIFL